MNISGLNGFITGIASCSIVVGSLSMWIISDLSNSIKAMSSQIAILQVSVASLNISNQNLEKRIDRIEK